MHALGLDFLAVQPNCLKGRVVCGTVYGEMHLKDLLGSFVSKAVETVLGLGGQKKFCAAKPRKFFIFITLTYKKDTILLISISVISKIH